jgi:predicted signal transduction protein with EAL and GGDEF domain
LGQELADQLLVAVAARLRASIESEDLLTRSGSGEFLILSRFASAPERVQALTASITRAFEEVFVIAGQQLHLAVSVGVATCPEHGTTRAELVRSADLALFAAMADRSSPVKTFEPIMAERVQDRLQLEQDLRAALETDELYLEYQPQFRTASLEVVGFEALARWNHTTRGRIRPDVFIPLAEETGIVIALGRRILEQACRTAMQWPEHIRIGVNLSPVQFRDPDLLATISDVLARTGLAASRLELEVTEGVLIADEEQALRTLSALREFGVGLALDDFGTGYASLSYLRKFPFERIKLDRSFVQAQVLEDRSRHILQSILGLSRKLGVGVIAEGVETRTQLHLLRQQGCEDIQGFLVGRPLPAGQTGAMIGPAPVGRAFATAAR